MAPDEAGGEDAQSPRARSGPVVSDDSFWVRLVSRSEFPLLIVGGVLVTMLLVELVLAWLWDPELGQAMLAGMAAEIITGREGGIPIAIQGGVPTFLVWQVSLVQDIAFFCLLYPWFLIFYHERSRRDDLGFIMRRLRRIEDAAKRHRKFARKWGPFGIFLFMLTPFLVNGPMIGGILGRLVGIRTRFLIAPIVGSTAIASAAWTFFYEVTFTRVNAIDPRLGYLIAGSLFVIFLLIGVIGVVIDERSHQLRQRAAEDRQFDEESEHPQE